MYFPIPLDKRFYFKKIPQNIINAKIIEKNKVQNAMSLKISKLKLNIKNLVN